MYRIWKLTFVEGGETIAKPVVDEIYTEFPEAHKAAQALKEADKNENNSYIIEVYLNHKVKPL
jgi:hypothetical protein